MGSITTGIGLISGIDTATLINSLIENNTGGSVGGLFLFGENADATITDSILHNNRTTNPSFGLGGAITVWDGADVTIRSSTLENNQARQGGGIYNEFSSSIITVDNDSS